jgi:hypothetical protein
MHEEMLNIPGHKGNADQNHIKIPPVFIKNTTMLVRMWGNRNLQTVLVGL